MSVVCLSRSSVSRWPAAARGNSCTRRQRVGCELLVTGETNFHTCLEAAALGMALILPGHYASERFAVETLAEHLQRQFPATAVWASRTEQDPLVWASSRP